MTKLFPTPDSIPFDVEEVYTAIQEYKGYPSSKVKCVHSPRLLKELGKCGWAIDNNGYLCPKGRFRLPALDFSWRKKKITAISTLLGITIAGLSLIGGYNFLLTFACFAPLSWVVIYCIWWIVNGSERFD